MYANVQGVLFGIGLVAVLATSLQAYAAYLIPAVIVVTAILAMPLAYMLASRMMMSSDFEVARAPASGDLAAGAPYERRARDTRQPSAYGKPSPSTQAEQDKKKAG